MINDEPRSSSRMIDMADHVHPDAILARLGALQAIIIMLLNEARAAIDVGPAQHNRLGAVTVCLADSLHSYQIFKHRRIFDPVITSGSPSSREAARYLKADCIAGAAAFSFFVRQWRDRSLPSVWEEFRPAVINLERQLRDHIKAEGVQIRLLLSHVGAEPGDEAAR